MTDQPCTIQVTLTVRCKWLQDAQDKARSLGMTLDTFIMRQVAKDLYPIPVDNGDEVS